MPTIPSGATSVFHISIFYEVDRSCVLGLLILDVRSCVLGLLILDDRSCVLGLLILSLFTISRLDFGTAPSVWYVFFLIVILCF
jgi:hypothetical protein